MKNKMTILLTSYANILISLCICVTRRNSFSVLCTVCCFCVQNGTCLIDGKCFLPGETRSESDVCWICRPENSMSNWTYGKSCWITCSHYETVNFVGVLVMHETNFYCRCCIEYVDFSDSTNCNCNLLLCCMHQPLFFLRCIV